MQGMQVTCLSTCICLTSPLTQNAGQMMVKEKTDALLIRRAKGTEGTPNLISECAQCSSYITGHLSVIWQICTFQSVNEVKLVVAFQLTTGCELKVHSMETVQHLTRSSMWITRSNGLTDNKKSMMLDGCKDLRHVQEMWFTTPTTFFLPQRSEGIESTRDTLLFDANAMVFFVNSQN